MRLFLALAASNFLLLHQFDVNNAFIHGFLDEQVYMIPPPGYTKASPGQVCHLQRSLYGLKQASRQWNSELTQKLISVDFQQSKHDHCLFTKGTGHHFIALLIYVDDILVTSPSLQLITDIKTFLHKSFTIKDLGDAKYFLGLEIARSPQGMYISQHKYALDLISEAGLMGSKPASAPMLRSHNLKGSKSTLMTDPDKFRRLIGRLLYLGFTRPDINYATQQLSQFMHNPYECHWQAALYILRYLKSDPARGLFYPVQSSVSLTAYSDADWAACKDTRRSISGYCVFFGKCLISCKAKKQTTISRSSTEAEYRSLSSTVCELLWISYLLHDLHISFSSPIPLFCDSQAAIHITANPVFHERTKHLDIDCHLVREHFRKGFVSPQHVSSSAQLADLFTKPLAPPQFHLLVSKLGLLSFNPSPT